MAGIKGRQESGFDLPEGPSGPIFLLCYSSCYYQIYLKIALINFQAHTLPVSPGVGFSEVHEVLPWKASGPGSALAYSGLLWGIVAS